MFIILAGTPGCGKSTIAAVLAQSLPRTIHLEVDRFRLALGTQERTNPAIEDALNWRLYTRSINHFRDYKDSNVVLDSTGISKRLPYLRQALADYDQVLVRFTSSFPYALCTKKWGSAYSQAQFEHIQKMVMELRSDYDIRVDGKHQSQVAEEIIRTLEESRLMGDHHGQISNHILEPKVSN